MTLRLIEAPDDEPATVSEVKLDARIDGTALDATIGVLITAARRKAEDLTGRALMTQTWELVLDAFPANGIRIGKLPIGSITSVKYYDTAGELQTLAEDQYTLDADTLPGWLFPAYGVVWPSTLDIPNAVIVRFVAGYGDAEDVPAEIRMWIRLRAATMVYQQTNVFPGTIVNQMPHSYVDGLLDAYKLWWI